MSKQHLSAALVAATAMAAPVVTAAPANAGCVDPAGIPLAQMCDSPVDTDGMWERCLTTYPGGPLNPATVKCGTMSAGDPPKEGDPAMLTPPSHIDP